jgi:GT2 family glycosyltransferase
LEQKFNQFQFIKNPSNVGYSEGNNNGIAAALEQGADYIFLLNNDTLVDPEMLPQMLVEAEADPTIGIVGPTMFFADPADMLWGGENHIDWRTARVVRKDLGMKIDWEKRAAEAPRRVDYIDSCAVLVRRAALELVGGLDPRYFINFDDVDLNVRVRKAGFSVVYVPSARMWHRVSAAMGLFSPATVYFMTRNTLLFFSTHLTGPQKWLSVSKLLARTCRTVTACTIQGKYRTEADRNKRKAELLGVRDYFRGSFGPMSEDAARVCQRINPSPVRKVQ